MKRLKTILITSIVVALSGCVSTGDEGLTEADKANMALIKWNVHGTMYNHRGLVVTGINNEVFPMGGEYWLTPGSHTIRYECGRKQGDTTIDGRRWPGGNVMIEVKAGKTYFLQGSLGRACILQQYEESEAKKQMPSIAAMML